MKPDPIDPEARFRGEALIAFAAQTLARAGLAEDRAGVVAATLVEADLMGHSTHGLALLGPYVKELESGKMTTSGEPETVRDSGAAIVWNGRYLPGPWLVHRAIDLALDRIAAHPLATVVIHQSHHIACLAAYPERATQRGLMLLLASSAPDARSVAPFGAIGPVYSPNPLAAGIPTAGEPILIDISMSTTAFGTAMRAHKAGRRLPRPWLLDADGRPTDDPAALFNDPPATILPLGGLDAGHKGFALGLLIEALTGALGGHGRADAPRRWTASVFLQVIDPAAFGGREAFAREMEWLANACRNAPVRPGDPPARLPGERALRLRAEQRRLGVRLDPPIVPPLQILADRLGIALPAPIAAA